LLFSAGVGAGRCEGWRPERAFAGVFRTARRCLLTGGRIQARVAEILAAGAERAEITVEKVLRELAVLGFSDIGKVVRWRPEIVLEELEDEEGWSRAIR
jgi:hypothetical protein